MSSISSVSSTPAYQPPQSTAPKVENEPSETAVQKDKPGVADADDTGAAKLAGNSVNIKV